MASISNAGPFIEFVELDTYKEVLSVCDTHVKFKDGKMHVPETPGLGIIVNEEKLKKLAREKGFYLK
jgi:L-alanine-DL-glutamate epimerase-like enolase superfamily enzyme